VLRRYAKEHTDKLEMLIKDMKIYRDKVEIADGVERLLGYEGMAARTYFGALSEIIELVLYEFPRKWSTFHWYLQNTLAAQKKFFPSGK